MDYNGKKILVTGAAGLIGREICQQLSKFNCEVIGVDNNQRYANYTPTGCRYIATDLIEFISTTKEKFDIIFHMAAINGTSNFYDRPTETLSNNIFLDLVIFKFAEATESKIVYASSSEVVADTLSIPTVEEQDVFIKDIHNPRWSYRLPKILSENYLANSNLNYLIVRFFNVIGEHSGSGHFVGDLITNIKNKNFSLVGHDETRSFCYVVDAVDALLNVSTKCSNTVINVGSDQEITIISAANTIAHALGFDNVEWSKIGSRVGSVTRRCPDISKLKSVYPEYSPNNFDDIINKIKDKLC
jgi:nucleoside-diphosphate-sugar epimerase